MRSISRRACADQLIVNVPLCSDSKTVVFAWHSVTNRIPIDMPKKAVHSINDLEPVLRLGDRRSCVELVSDVSGFDFLTRFPVRYLGWEIYEVRHQRGSFVRTS